MRRSVIALAAMGLAAIIFSFMASAASAATNVTGLDNCVSGPGCHFGPIHDSFPNYKGVCSIEDCNFVSAANWEEVGTGVTTDPSILKNDYSQAGQTFGGGLSMPDLWTYWKSSGIDGVYLSSEQAISRAQSVVEHAVLAHRAVIAESRTGESTYMGTTRYQGGTAILIGDGFTPKGPIVVYQGRTIQMTWAQWNAQVRFVWEVLVTRSPPTTTTPPPPPPTTTAPSASLAISSSSVPSTGGTITLTSSSENATICKLTSVPSLWSAGYVSVNCNGTYQIDVVPSTSEQHWTFTFSVSNSSDQNATATQTLTQSAPQAPAENQSEIWSGYVVPSSSALVTDAQGDWTVPTLNCADTPEGQVSIWIGIGGTGGNSGSLLQTGINISCVDGFQDDVAWWEVVPATPNYEETFKDFPVAPGDEVEASVFESTTGAWETEVSDVNTGLSAHMITGESWGVGPTSTGDFTVQGSAAGISYDGGYTAEWIVEDPTNSSTLEYAPFANFGSVTFSDLESSFNSWSLTPDEAWAIVQNGETLATPAATTTDGFTVEYT